MNSAIREAETRLTEASAAAEAVEAARRSEAEARMESQRRHSMLLLDGLETLAGLLDGAVEADAKFTRKAIHDGESTDAFYLPAASKLVHWYNRTQPGWWLTTSARWDAAVRVLGEHDLRVAILANGKLSRPLPMASVEERADLAQAIIDACAKHGLTWPDDGPDLTSIVAEAR